MQTLLRYIVLGLVLVAILSFMVTYTVRFTENAVITTFGKAGEDAIKAEPGLYFKLPYPIQSVTKYDTRARFLEARPETQQTADDRQVIVTAYATYRVSDPLKFFQAFSGNGSRPETHFRAADDVLRNKLRAAVSQISSFRLNELLGPGSTTNLPALEMRILDGLRRADAATPGGSKSSTLTDFGMEPIAVGISSLKLPEDTTKAVFERMKQTRDRISQEAVSKGNAEAAKIKSQAESERDTILSFAESRAKAIRGEGDRQAARYLALQNTDPELAVFLKNLEFMREAVASRITLVLPTDLPGMSLFAPGAADQLRTGKLPKADPGTAPAVPAAAAKQGGGQ